MRDRTTRRDLLVGGMTIGAAGGAGTALLSSATAPAASTTTGQADPAITSAAVTAHPSESDAGRLRRLLSVELLLLFCYRHVLAASVLTSRAVGMVTPLSSDERAHVSVLTDRLTGLGGTLPKPPASLAEANRYLGRRKVSERLGQLRSGRDALRLLLDVERVTVGAYFVALIKLQDPALIRLAAEIMANDAQHEAVLGEVLHPGDAQDAVPYGLVQGVQ